MQASESAIRQWNNAVSGAIRRHTRQKAELESSCAEAMSAKATLESANANVDTTAAITRLDRECTSYNATIATLDTMLAALDARRYENLSEQEQGGVACAEQACSESLRRLATRTKLDMQAFCERFMSAKAAVTDAGQEASVQVCKALVESITTDLLSVAGEDVV